MRAVIIQNGKILICRAKEKDHYFLPGGHIEHGESQEEALAREIKEETGIDVTGTKFMAEIPHSYAANGEKYEEVNYVYVTELSNYEISSLEPQIDFAWIPISNFDNVGVLPNKLKQRILSILNRGVINKCT